MTAVADSLILLHTNDTHSNIESDENGVGGILPRKAIVDSVRKAEKNVILIDAGDMVQGTLYFKYFGGGVEYPLFNMMDYDIRILGNHEFDNGLKQLARYWKQVKADRLSANYDFTGTEAEGLFKPYVIKKIGKKKIGFIGINVDPASLISVSNTGGMKYHDAIAAANRYAALLKDKEKCDLVVAVTHIGYDEGAGKASDVALARESKDIDIIIGGHSHTYVDPKTPDKTPYWINNAEGRPVLVAQTGKYGRNVGYIKIDLDNLAKHEYGYECIPVTDRFSPTAYDKKMVAFLAPYQAKVDSIDNVPVVLSRVALDNVREASPIANWVGDMGEAVMNNIVDSLNLSGMKLPYPDFALMNVGGIRQPLPEGMVSEGRVLSMFPFSNKLMLIRMKGKDFIETMGIVSPDGEAVSDRVRVVTDGKEMKYVLLDGKPMDPDRDYVVTTIDYIAEGNDGMLPMARHELLYTDNCELGYRILDHLRVQGRHGLAIDPDRSLRFVKDYRDMQ